MQEMKKCSKCGVEYPKTREHFYKSGKHMQSWCKKCWEELNDSRKEYKRQHYLQNKQKYNEAARKRYRELHPKEELPSGYKRCSVCKQVKLLSEFGKYSKAKDGLRYSCKLCRKQEYLANKEHHLKKRREYYRDNKERILRRSKTYKERRADWYREYGKNYYQNNSGRIKHNVKKYHFKRMETDPAYKLLVLYRTRLYQALKGYTKSKSTRRLIGCPIKQLKEHLESQFEEGMSWDNYGEWHVDHIKPCALFDFSKIEEQKACFHYTNLQPLWAEENQRKGARYEGTS